MKSPSIMTKASIGTKISSCWCVSGLNRKESPPLVCAIEFDNFVEYIVTIYVFFIFFLGKLQHGYSTSFNRYKKNGS